MRDCENCKNHTDKGCTKWECEFEPTTKNDLGVDAVSRKAVINQIFYSTDNNGDVVLGSALRERIARLPSVTPQLSSELEKNSKKLEKDIGELISEVLEDDNTRLHFLFHHKATSTM